MDRYDIWGQGQHASAHMLTLLLEAAVTVEDTKVLTVLTDLLADLPPVTWIGQTSPVSTTRQLGAAAVKLGKPHAARVHYQQALEVCEKIHFRPEIALTRLGLAELLLEHYPEERAQAIGHLDFAIAEFRDMKMQPSLERALRHRGLLKA